MSIGMTYEEFYDEDPHLVRYYLKADELRRKRMNEEAWLQGFYVYRVFESYRELIGMKNKPKIYPYPEPLPLTEEEMRAKKEEEARIRMERIKSRMMQRSLQINANMKGKGESNG